MNYAPMPSELISEALQLVRPAFVQAAALCLRSGSRGREVMLIRTFTRKQWVIPKGWPMQNRTLAEAAAIEAWEEAGVRGRVHPEAIGAFTYTKLKKSGLPVQCRAQVFMLDVDSVHDIYPEAKRRIRQWASLPDAAGMVKNRQLKALLASM